MLKTPSLHSLTKTVGVPTRFSHSKAKKDRKIPFWSSLPSPTWGLSLNFTLEEMVHPYVMVHFCILITKRQALVLREEFPGTLRMVLLFRNLVEAVQLFIPRSILVVNLAVNRKAGDFLQVPQGFFYICPRIRIALDLCVIYPFLLFLCQCW